MALFLFSKLGTWRSWPILWWMVECYTQWLLLQLHFPKKHWIAYRPWRIAQSLGELGTYVYRMHKVYMCIFHTHTSFHGHDFELRNISRHMYGKKPVKIACFSRLLWFERYMSGTWVVGLGCIWPFPLSKEGHAFFRPHVLVALQKEGSKISLKNPGEVFTPPQKSNRHSPLKRAWKNDEGFFWMTKWQWNLVFKQHGEEKLPWRMDLSNDTTIHWIYPLRMPVATRFFTSLSLHFPLASWFGGIDVSLPWWRSWKNTFNGVCQSSCLSKQRPGKQIYFSGGRHRRDPGNFSLKKNWGSFFGGNPLLETTKISLAQRWEFRLTFGVLRDSDPKRLEDRGGDFVGQHPWNVIFEKR